MVEIRRPNIKQVAEHAGVSVATISRALVTPGLLAPATLDRVNASIRTLGYYPNVQARKLRTAQTRLIIALVPDISNPFFAEVIRGIEQVARDAGYSVLLGDTRYDAAIENSYADFVSTRQADGLISLLPRVPPLRAEGAGAQGSRIPFVNVSEYVDDAAIARVHVDNVAAMAGATDYLLSLGHRRIAHVRGRSGSPISLDRERGYRRALESWGVAVDPALVVGGDFSVESGIRAAERLFAGATMPTAIVCANDETAIGVIDAALDQGMRVPEDLSVAGFDDIPLARHFRPALTTVAQPMHAIGREAAQLLLEILRDPATPPRRRIMPTQLIVRGSTGRPPSQVAKSIGRE